MCKIIKTTKHGVEVFIVMIWHLEVLSTMPEVVTTFLSEASARNFIARADKLADRATLSSRTPIEEVRGVDLTQEVEIAPGFGGALTKVPRKKSPKWNFDQEEQHGWLGLMREIKYGAEIKK